MSISSILNNVSLSKWKIDFDGVELTTKPISFSVRDIIGGLPLTVKFADKAGTIHVLEATKSVRGKGKDVIKINTNSEICAQASKIVLSTIWETCLVHVTSTNSSEIHINQPPMDNNTDVFECYPSQQISYIRDIPVKGQESLKYWIADSLTSRRDVLLKNMEFNK